MFVSDVKKTEGKTLSPSDFGLDLVAEVFGEAAFYIEHGWTQGTSARDSHGNPCSPYSNHAECWCAVGAINATIECNRPGPEDEDWRNCLFSRAYSVLSAELKEAVTDWNDSSERTKEDVARVFRGISDRLWHHLDPAFTGIKDVN